MRTLAKIFFCSAVLLFLTSYPALATDPFSDPFSSPDFSDLYKNEKPNDPIIDTFQQIEDPSLEPYSPNQWGI